MTELNGEPLRRGAALRQDRLVTGRRNSAAADRLVVPRRRGGGPHDAATDWQKAAETGPQRAR